MFSELVDCGEAPWIQLCFDGVDLGNASYVRITSVANGDVQTLNARMMNVWNSATGVFQGGQLLVELIVAPGDQGVTLRVAEALVGEFSNDNHGGPPETICGTVDNRVLSFDSRIGRLFLVAAPLGWHPTAPC